MVAEVIWRSVPMERSSSKGRETGSECGDFQREQQIRISLLPIAPPQDHYFRPVLTILRRTSRRDRAAADQYVFHLSLDVYPSVVLELRDEPG